MNTKHCFFCVVALWLLSNTNTPGLSCHLSICEWNLANMLDYVNLQTANFWSTTNSLYFLVIYVIPAFDNWTAYHQNTTRTSLSLCIVMHMWYTLFCQTTPEVFNMVNLEFLQPFFSSWKFISHIVQFTLQDKCGIDLQELKICITRK